MILYIFIYMKIDKNYYDIWNINHLHDTKK